jgi:DNA-binding PadR family transcriptional regulator
MRKLGDFEQLVLLAVLRLGDDAYAVPVREEIARRTGRSVARGAVYVTLERLEDKRLLTSSLGEPTPERGGRAKRFYKVSPNGLATLQSSWRGLKSLWAGLEPARS